MNLTKLLVCSLFINDCILFSHSLRLLPFNLRSSASISSALIMIATQLASPLPTITYEKLVNLEDSKVSKIVADDITLRQALVTADFSREIYDEKCKFQDEIDTYALPDYVKGTKALFVADKSHVDLDGPVNIDPESKVVSFHFKEKLTFNVPFNPYVLLSGRVELKRGADGLIVYSREFWDQPVNQVLSGIRF